MVLGHPYACESFRNLILDYLNSDQRSVINNDNFMAEPFLTIKINLVTPPPLPLDVKTKSTEQKSDTTDSS